MTEDEQIGICKAIAVSCMWGHGGIGSVILDRFERDVAAPRKWQEVYREVAKSAQREAVGVIDDEAELKVYQRRGYWLTNYDEDGCSLFNPPPMNGLARYVSKRLGEKYPKASPYTQTISPTVAGMSTWGKPAFASDQQREKE